jgi:hypothetical protein
MDQSAVDKLMVAVRHPIRRTMLAKVVQADGAISPKDLSASMGMPLSNVSYHARVLVECDAIQLVDTRPVRGSVQHFYDATALLGHPLAKAILKSVGNVGTDSKSEEAR